MILGVAAWSLLCVGLGALGAIGYEDVPNKVLCTVSVGALLWSIGVGAWLAVGLVIS